jgi:hypothetical protein
LCKPYTNLKMKRGLQKCKKNAKNDVEKSFGVL